MNHLRLKPLAGKVMSTICEQLQELLSANDELSVSSRFVVRNILRVRDLATAFNAQDQAILNEFGVFDASPPLVDLAHVHDVLPRAINQLDANIVKLATDKCRM